MNVFCIVGKLAKKPELTETSGGFYMANIEIAVDRPFANCMGIYENDCITVEVWRGAADRLAKEGKEGQMVSAKGRIANRQTGDEPNYAFVAERVELLE